MDTRKLAVLFGGGYDVGSGITTYYPLDEGSGVQVEDFSQYANHGILKNGPVWGIVDGVTGLTFDGVNDYIEDSKGRHIVKEGTTGFWSEVKIGDETKIVGTGTKFYFSTVGDNLEGQFITDFAEYCTNLTYFRCATNSFSGTLPTFAACTNLTYFYCHTNSFSGTLPTFAACTNLTYFYCHTNSFSGTLPTFAACTNLIDFHCHTNSFSGTLPNFAACTSLGTFQCYLNSFSGTLPNFAACTSLTDFRCYGNSFNGTLPSFAACTSLAYFSCSTNSFSGTLPTFAACTSLGTFACHTNNFSGYTSGSFATQIGLTFLNASTNTITATADINAILADLRTSYDLPGRVACTVKLEGGTNAVPTGQGITDKNFLNANGWTVTTN